MKRIFYMAAVACLALFTSCEKPSVEHTGDPTGKLYGKWVLDTKDVVSETITNGKSETKKVNTDFTDEHFYLLLAEPRMAMATFDVDDVDAHRGEGFSYNADLMMITFNRTLELSSGFPPRVMLLDGTYDILELSDRLVLRSLPEELVISNLVKTKKTTTYAFHRLVEQQRR